MIMILISNAYGELYVDHFNFATVSHEYCKINAHL